MQRAEFKELGFFCHFPHCIKLVMFAFQRADSIRPALNNSVERHSTDQEDTGTITQVIWHKNGQKAQLEAAWTGRCLWFCTRSGWWQPFLAFHIRANTVRRINQIGAWCPCRGLFVCFSFSSLRESALKRYKEQKIIMSLFMSDQPMPVCGI